MPVGQIKIGMHIVEADGQVGVISGWKVVPGIKTMYNLEVAQDHTFTVGVGQWVVHNCTDPEYNANGDPELRALRRPEFDSWKNDGLEINGGTYNLGDHAYNSLFKSGRKDIMPSDIIAALNEEPRLGTPGSVEYINPKTGTSVFVNPQTHEIVGVWPEKFKR